MQSGSCGCVCGASGVWRKAERRGMHRDLVVISGAELTIFGRNSGTLFLCFGLVKMCWETPFSYHDLKRQVCSSTTRRSLSILISSLVISTLSTQHPTSRLHIALTGASMQDPSWVRGRVARMHGLAPAIYLLHVRM